MTAEHPNVALLSRFDPRDPAGAPDLFADDVVWRYFNPSLPDVQGEYVGLDGIRAFFDIIAKKSGGTFTVTPISITPVGEELVVTQVRDTLTFQDRSIALDVVVVWRIVSRRIVEVWDIVPGQPSEH